MPRNNARVPREERIDRILGVAEQILVERGFSDATLSQVAKTLGTATNAVVWYSRQRTTCCSVSSSDASCAP